MEVISHAISDSPRRQKTMFSHRLNTQQSRRRGKVDGNQVGGTYYVKQVNPGTIGASERSQAIPGSLGSPGKGSVWRNKCTGSWWMVSDSQQNTTPVNGPASHVWLLSDVENGSDFSHSISKCKQLQVHSLGVKQVSYICWRQITAVWISMPSNTHQPI